MTLINGRAYGIHGEPAAHMVNLKPGEGPVLELVHVQADVRGLDRKSTRLNSSHRL